jgi:hypothetical protein
MLKCISSVYKCWEKCWFVLNILTKRLQMMFKTFVANTIWYVKAVADIRGFSKSNKTLFIVSTKIK